MIKKDQETQDWMAERLTWGWLGRPPDVVIKCRGEIWEAWADLSKRAKAVADMRYSKAKVQAAKNIGERRQELINRAEKVLNDK